ncbi:MAG: elongation factor 4 [Deltaproteobacteria bacterium RIFCSPHIGHO2_12_FULL_43_9]|nr:MAG: elongation factor 4 [Deltaproteobacteria bacterium RIFCSPHIGHO2_12_FULL_43_9]
MPQQDIRNFCIIAHIDHGKSTLADRILEITGALSKREAVEQFLDKMDIERERGITIKAQAVRLSYKANDGKIYQLNLIDTPGHVDFTYEVSRSLKSCDGAILVVDASQGVEAQTLANVHMALDQNLDIVPFINKIDLPAADPEKTKKEIEEIIGLDCSDAISGSGKLGTGVKELLEQVITKLPPPKGDENAPLQALIFDSWFDSYQGVITLVRVFNGKLKVGMPIKLMHKEKVVTITKLGVFTPHAEEINELNCGEVGFFAANIKDVRDTKIGDTVTGGENPATFPLEGFKNIKPMVFSGVFPVESHQYAELKESLEKLALNDSSFTYEPETSAALGFGFRCGFLGLLHMEIVQERLEREYNLSLIVTAPSVIYKVYTTDGEEHFIENPSLLPDASKIERIAEPIIKATIPTPVEYIGNIIKLCEERRGVQERIDYLTESRVLIIYRLPLSEMIFDFYDKLKSSTKGYASLDYEITGYETSDLVKLDILLNGDPVDALSCIIHKEKAYYRGRELVKKLRGLIPRQLFEIAVQAAIGSKVIARESISALRKNVTAKCYGGDITRKRKLLEKQKEGKKRMKQVGAVEIPQEAFLAVLKID